VVASTSPPSGGGAVVEFASPLRPVDRSASLADDVLAALR